MKTNKPGQSQMLVCCLLSLSSCSFGQQLFLNSGVSFVSNGNIKLVLHNASLKNNGYFVPGSGTVKMAGNADSSISYFTGNTTTNINDLDIAKYPNSAIANSQLDVRGTVTMMTGNFNANNNLTFISEAAATAKIAEVPASCNIFGKVNVERYYPAKRAWRLVTGPVKNSNTIFQSWQNGGMYQAGRGTMISNPVVANGIDTNTSSSLKRWVTGTGSFEEITDTYTPVSAGTGSNAVNTAYLLFIRGDRTTSNIGVTNSNITTLSCNGELQVGTQTFSASGTAGSVTLIGNPYASPVDFATVTRTNLINRFYVWDPKINKLGAYITIDDVDNDGVYTTSNSSSQQTRHIQSSQAFFVETAAGGSASLTFNESNKSAGGNNLVFRPAYNTGSLRATLLLNDNGTYTNADELLAEFSPSYSPAVDFAEDAPKFFNINEGISLLRENKMLSIERRPLVNTTDTLFLQFTKTVARAYRIIISPVNLANKQTIAFFEDTYLNTSSIINLQSSTEIDFEVIQGVAASTGSRFRIVFKPLSTLPVNFITVDANRVLKDVIVNWQTGAAANTSSYSVEKSTDGQSFSSVTTIAANINAITGSYSYTDYNTNPALTIYYRIKSTSANGTEKYSSTVKVEGKRKQEIVVLNNPAKNGIIELQLNNQKATSYNFRLYNSAGGFVFTKTATINAGNSTYALYLNNRTAAGLYHLEIEHNGVKETKIIMVE